MPLPVTADAGSRTLPAFTLNDQFGRAHTLDETVRRIYFNRDRKGDRLLKTALAKPGQARLDAQRAIVIADISAMPGFVKRFALSSLRERPHAIWLDPDGALSAQLPYREDQVTVVELSARRITAVRFVDDEAGLGAELAR